MIIWFSLIIAILGSSLLIWKFKNELHWGKYLVPVIVSILIILLTKSISESIEVSDTEYLGQLAYKARYTESYTTWVDQTCSRSVPCGSDSKGNTKYCTEYYDCSYCSDHSPEWELIDDGGNTYNITEDYYNYLIKKWQCSPQFVELNRNIVYHGGCGKDGNMYEIFWNKEVLTSVPTVRTHNYENRVKVSSSSFNYPKITEEDKKNYSLFEYPKVNGFQQQTILGQDQFTWLSSSDKDTAETYAKYLCGYFGPRKQMKLIVLLFKNQMPLAANMQEAYWVNGNKNEIVICIGLNSKNNKITWIRPFSWTTNRTLLVNLREDIMKIDSYDFKQIYSVLAKDLPDFQRKQFKEFSYLTVEPSNGAIWIAFLAILIFTCWYIWFIYNTQETKNNYSPYKKW